MTTKKIQTLRLGEPTIILTDASRLLKLLRLTSCDVELAHPASSLVQKLHKVYGNSMLLRRSLICLAKPLLPADEVFGKEERLLRQIAPLEARVPTRTSGRHEYYARLVETAHSQVPEGQTLSQEAKTLLVKKHADWYALLDLDERQGHDALAKVKSSKRARVIHDDIQHTRDQLRMCKKRVAEWALKNGVQFRLGGARFHARDLEEIAAIHNSEAFSMSNVEAKRAAALIPPPLPSTAFMGYLTSIEISGKPIPLRRGVAEWILAWCANRLDVANFFFRLKQEGGDDIYVAFIFAKQSPSQVSFSKLDLVLSVLDLHAIADSRTWASAIQDQAKYMFISDENVFFNEATLPDTVAANVEVFDHVLRGPGRRFSTIAQPVPFLERVKGLYHTASTDPGGGGGGHQLAGRRGSKNRGKTRRSWSGSLASLGSLETPRRKTWRRRIRPPTMSLPMGKKATTSF